MTKEISPTAPNRPLLANPTLGARANRVSKEVVVYAFKEADNAHTFIFMMSCIRPDLDVSWGWPNEEGHLTIQVRKPIAKAWTAWEGETRSRGDVVDWMYGADFAG